MLHNKNLFEPLNKYFDKIYIITLKRATDRHETIIRDLNGLNYELFFGVDKKDLDIASLEKTGIYSERLYMQNSKFIKAMTSGQIGCSYSHVKVYEDIIQNNYSKVLILEDDVIVDFENITRFNEIIAELPANWDLLYLGYSNKNISPFMQKIKQLTYHMQRSLNLSKWSHIQIANLYAKEYSRHLKIAGYHDCTHAYCLTPEGAKTLLKHQTPISFVADNLLAHCITNKFIRAFISKYKIFNQDWQIGIPQSKSYLNS